MKYMGTGTRIKLNKSPKCGEAWFLQMPEATFFDTMMCIDILVSVEQKR